MRSVSVVTDGLGGSGGGVDGAIREVMMQAMTQDMTRGDVWMMGRFDMCNTKCNIIYKYLCVNRVDNRIIQTL